MLDSTEINVFLLDVFYSAGIVRTSYAISYKLSKLERIKILCFK